MRDNEFTRILDWPGYRVFRHEIDETAKTLRLWVRRKRGNRKLICSGCGRKFSDAHDYYQREVRDLPWRKYRTTVIIELYRVCCPECGVRVEKVPQLPSKAPFSKDFEDAVGLACESASVRQVARQFGLAASTVRAIDLRYLKRWSATRRKDRLAQMGVDEIYFGKQMKSDQRAGPYAPHQRPRNDGQRSLLSPNYPGEAHGGEELFLRTPRQIRRQLKSVINLVLGVVCGFIRVGSSRRGRPERSPDRHGWPL
jgi:hypothetical protein